MLYYRVYLHTPSGTTAVRRHGEPAPAWVDHDTEWSDYRASCDGAAVEHGAALAQDRLQSFYGTAQPRYAAEWYCL